MSHRPSKRRNRIDGQFAPQTIEMLRSPAWRVSSLTARRVINRIEIELADHGGTDNGKLPVTYDDFEDYGIDRHAIAPAIRETVALGFVEVTERGRAGNAEFRSPSLYRLTYRDTNRAVPTNEWKRIQTIEEALDIARSARMTTAQKQKPSGGKRDGSVGITHTESANSPVGTPPTTASVRKTLTTLNILGVEPELPAFLDRRTGRGERLTGASEASSCSAALLSKATH